MPNFIAEVERKFTDMVGLLNIRAIGSLDPVHISKALNQTVYDYFRSWHRTRQYATVKEAAASRAAAARKWFQFVQVVR